MRRYLIPSILALAVATTAVLHGCGTGTGTVFHETSSLYLKSLSPSINMAQVSNAGTTNESLIFKETQITLGNFSAIPVTLSQYKVDYSEIRNGLSVPSLTMSGRLTMIIPGITGFPYAEPRLPDSGSGGGASGTTGTTAASGTATTATGASTGSSGSGASAAQGSVVLQLWTPAVRNYAFQNGSKVSRDNRDLQATVTLFGTDFNGNSATIQAVADLTATLGDAASAAK